MDTKIWKEPITLAQVEKVIDEYVKKEISNLQEQDLLEKWNYFSIISVEDDKTIAKFLETVEYMDETSLLKNKKIHFILTLGYLMTKEKLDISKMDVNNIFLLVAYLDELSLENIKTSLKYLNDESLLFKIRFKSLDMEIRLKLIEYLDKVRKTVKDSIQFIESTEYYELIKMIEG